MFQFDIGRGEAGDPFKVANCDLEAWREREIPSLRLHRTRRGHVGELLRSPVAVRVSIQVVRAFVNLRRMLATHEDLARQVDAIERRVGKHDVELQDVLRILRKLLEPPPMTSKRSIGFVPLAKEK